MMNGRSRSVGLVAQAAWRSLAAGASLVLIAAGAAAQARFDFDNTPGSLPKEVVPSRYALTLDLDPARDRFAGQVRISLQVRRPVDAIVINADRLRAGAVSLTDAGGRVRRLQVSARTATRTWRLALPRGERLPAGDYALAIDYTGTVHVTDEGLFRAEYRPQGAPARRERMLATQLEAAAARSVFPSFDEPSFRSIFEIAVRAPADCEAYSNMPELSRSDDADGVLHRFAPTPSMPTYLVSVAVGRLEALAGEAGEVPLRLLTVPGKTDQARYALQATQQVMPYYADYFAVPYALPKLDQLAVPSTRSGAMEDWGLISYAETDLLFDPARSAPDTERDVFATVAHEIAHQWFGNLVTAASWDEIWLNEAFATWMQNKASDHFNPGWNVPLHDRWWRDSTMESDASNATRAIRSGPVSETTVNDVFDNVTYQKGSAVLGMIEQWAGPEAFRRGLGAYLRGQQYSNATAGDLWAYLGAATGQDVAAVASNWTDQPGFPLVSVQSACEGGSTRGELRQSRFMLDGSTPPAQTWRIPVRLARAGTAQTVMLDQPTGRFELPGCSEAPLVVNAGGAAFYRVAYAPEALQRLTSGFVALAPADRVELMSDSLALAQAGRQPMAAWFALLSRLPAVQDESRTALFEQAAEGLRFLDAALAGTPAQAGVRAAGRALLGPELQRIGLMPDPGDDSERLMLRSNLIGALARFDDAAVLERATQWVDEDEAGQAPLPASIRAAAIVAAGQRPSAARFDRLVARLHAARGEEERLLYARALASTRDPGQARRVLELSLDGGLPTNVATGLPSGLGRYSPFGDTAYRFVLDHWQQLAPLAGASANSRSWLLSGTARNFNDAGKAARLLQDQRGLLGADGDAEAERVAARIGLLAAVREREASALVTALADWRPLP